MQDMDSSVAYARNEPLLNDKKEDSWIGQKNFDNRWFSNLVDASKSFDEAGPGFLVEPLRVTELAFFQRGVNEHLDEGQRRLGALVDASAS